MKNLIVFGSSFLLSVASQATPLDTFLFDAKDVKDRSTVSAQQHIIREADFRVGNPEFPPDAGQHNSKHKVLVAVIGNGVDYWHPRLKNSMHYLKNEDGSLRLGWDFVGNDPYPAPYIVQTLPYDSEATTFFRDVYVEQGAKYEKLLKSLAAQIPTLAAFFDSRRDVRLESANGVEHETMVTSLLVEEDASIGILPYRTLPYTFAFTDGGAEMLLYRAVYRGRILAALKRAVADGAQIVNMSFAIRSTPDDQDSEDTKYFEKEIEALFRASPQVTFVASSGNLGRRLNAKNEKVLPCESRARNLICVASLDEHDRPSGFNSIPQKKRIAYARGEGMESDIPQGLCPAVDLYQILSDLYFKGEMQVSEEVKADLLQKCSAPYQRVRWRGTSVAAPVYAKELARKLLRKAK